MIPILNFILEGHSIKYVSLSIAPILLYIQLIISFIFQIMRILKSLLSTRQLNLVYVPCLNLYPFHFLICIYFLNIILILFDFTKHYESEYGWNGG